MKSMEAIILKWLKTIKPDDADAPSVLANALRDEGYGKEGLDEKKVSEFLEERIMSMITADTPKTCKEVAKELCSRFSPAIVLPEPLTCETNHCVASEDCSYHHGYNSALPAVAKLNRVVDVEKVAFTLANDIQAFYNLEIGVVPDIEEMIIKALKGE